MSLRSCVWATVGAGVVLLLSAVALSGTRRTPSPPVIGTAVASSLGVDMAATATATPGPVPDTTTTAPTTTVVVATSTAPTTTTAPPATTAVPATTTAPTTTTAAPPSGTSCGGWLDLVSAHFPAGQVQTACRVMLCESGGLPTAQNPVSSASGAWQFITSTWRRARDLVPGAGQYAVAAHAPMAVQTAVAAAWWRATSWSQWECY